MPFPIIAFFNVSAVARYTTGAKLEFVFDEFDEMDVTILLQTEPSEFDAKPSVLNAAASKLKYKASKFAELFNVATILVAFTDEVRFRMPVGGADEFTEITGPTGATYSILE
jgi:hypothetical protein